MEKMHELDPSVIPLPEDDVHRLIKAAQLLKAVYVAMGRGYISEELAAQVDFYFEEDEETH